MAYTKKTWVDVPDPSNPPSIPEGQDALARFDAENMNRVEDGIKEAHDLYNGLEASTLHNLGYAIEYTTVLEAAKTPSIAGYTFFAVQGSTLFYAEDSAFKNNEVQYFVLVDTNSGIRRTVIAYCYSYNTIKMRKIYAGSWHTEWYSVITEGQTVDNSDMVDGLHSYNLATLSEAGTSHGTAYPMFCQHNLRGKYRFDISVEGFEVGVDHATTADSLTNTNLELVSYVGTGTYGIDNPCSLTFGFAPKIIKFMAKEWTDSKGTGKQKGYTIHKYSSGATEGIYDVIACESLPTEFNTNFYTGLNDGEMGDHELGCFGKKSDDGKTISWYSEGDEDYQFNSSGYTYYFLAIG